MSDFPNEDKTREDFEEDVQRQMADALRDPDTWSTNDHNQPTLPAALRVAGATFHEGVSLSTVQRAIDRISKEQKRLRKENRKLTNHIRRIQGLAGHPLPPAALRNILDEAEEALNDE